MPTAVTGDRATGCDTRETAMTEPATFTLWCIVVGVLLIAMTLGNSFIARLPLSAAMLYLVVGYAIGPAGLGLVDFDPRAQRDRARADLRDRGAHLAVHRGPQAQAAGKDHRWRVPVRLAIVSMMITVGGLALAGVFLLGLPLGAAVLLGAILAPTDPVLASDVQVAERRRPRPPALRPHRRRRTQRRHRVPVRHARARPARTSRPRRGRMALVAVDVAWAVGGGLAIGYLLGLVVGRTVLYLRTRHREALGADEFIAFGLIALAYGAAQACTPTASSPCSRPDSRCAASPTSRRRRAMPQSSAAATHAQHRQRGRSRAVPADMMSAVEDFNAQLERFAEVAVVIAIGALLAVVPFRREALWLVPLLFLVIRPLAVYAGLVGAPRDGDAASC